MKWLFVFIPAGLILAARHADPMLVFFTSALGIIPLAQMMGEATEDLSTYLGPATGGLLNASMGTLPDLILGIFALRHGLVDVVKASITGAIVGNMLLGVGLATLLGGSKFVKGLHFNPYASHLFGSLMLLASIGLVIPAIFGYSTDTDREISLEISVILLASYLLSVVFSLGRPVSPPDDDAEGQVDVALLSDKKPTGSLRGALGLLLGSTLMLAVMSEVLTEALEPAARMMGFTATFTGIFLLAPIGGAAELINAVRFGRMNQLDIALAATIGSSIQTALLAAPVLVFTGYAFGQPMNLLFGKFQVLAIIIAVVAINNTLRMGTVRWIGGAKLIAIYLMLAVGFYYQP
jgi:Ca2+:H+ antiporter